MLDPFWLWRDYIYLINIGIPNKYSNLSWSDIIINIIGTPIEVVYIYGLYNINMVCWYNTVTITTCNLRKLYYIIGQSHLPTEVDVLTNFMEKVLITNSSLQSHEPVQFDPITSEYDPVNAVLNMPRPAKYLQLHLFSRLVKTRVQYKQQMQQHCFHSARSSPLGFQVPWLTPNLRGLNSPWLNWVHVADVVHLRPAHHC